jgi:hypothetical protein
MISLLSWFSSYVMAQKKRVRAPAGLEAASGLGRMPPTLILQEPGPALNGRQRDRPFVNP